MVVSSSALAIDEVNRDRSAGSSSSKAFGVTDTSLQFAPIDADVYFSALRLRDQRQMFWDSAVCKEIRATSFYQSVARSISEQWEQPDTDLASLRIFLRTPAGKKLVAIADELFSEEAFFMGGKDTAQFNVDLFQLRSSMQEYMDELGIEGMSEWYTSEGKAIVERIAVPTLVFGCRFQDSNRLLDLIDQVNAVALVLPPSVASGMQRVEDSHGTRLTLVLSGKMIPFPSLRAMIPVPEVIELLDQLEQSIQDRQMTISFGMLDQYLIFSLSETPSDVTDLVSGKHLFEHPDAAPLKQLDDSWLTVSYVSDSLVNTNFQNNTKNFFQESLLPIVESLLEFSEDELINVLAPLKEDLPWLDDEMNQIITTPKGTTGYSRLLPDGWEGFLFARSKPILLDGSKPLEILQHCGKSPLMMIAGRHQYHPEWFELCRKVVKRARNYLELAVGEQLFEGDDAREAELFLKKGWPILSSLADLFEQKFLPATKDGQHAWVMHAGNLASDQWLPGYPKSKRSLTLPECAIITGVNDQAKLIEGFVGAFGVMDRALALGNELAPNSVPSGLSTARPKHQTSAIGDRYVYEIPSDLGLPVGLVPHAALNDAFMVWSYSDAQSKELLGRNRLSIGSTFLPQQEACAAASYCDVGGVFNLLTPWIEYGLEIAYEDLEAELVPADEESNMSIRAIDVVDLCKAMRRIGVFQSKTVLNEAGQTVTQVRYQEPGAP